MKSDMKRAEAALAVLVLGTLGLARRQSRYWTRKRRTKFVRRSLRVFRQPPQFVETGHYKDRDTGLWLRRTKFPGGDARVETVPLFSDRDGLAKALLNKEL